MLPVVRDLLAGVENLPDHRPVFVEARHLREVGLPVAKEKHWVVSNLTTGEGDYQMVDVPPTRPIEIAAGELRRHLNALVSKPVEVLSEATVTSDVELDDFNQSIDLPVDDQQPELPEID